MERYTREQEADLIESHMGLVVSLAKKFKPSSPEQLDEYIQVGRIGLWKAIRKQNPERGALSTLAWICIRNEILRHLKWLNRLHPCEVVERPCRETTNIWEYVPDAILSAKEQKVVELRYEGRTFKEIGELCGYTKNWAHKSWNTAVRKIQKANE